MTRLGALFCSKANRSLTVIVGLVLSTVLLLIAMAFWTVCRQSMIVESEQLSHSYEVRDNLQLLVRYLLDAETGQRGYLLTKDPSYFEPYRYAVAKVDDQLSVMRSLVVGSHEHIQAVKNVTGITQLKLDELAQTLTLEEQGDQLVESGTGKALMDSIRSLIVGLIDGETTRLIAKRKAFGNSSFTMTVTIVGCFLAALMSIAFTLTIMFRQISELTNNRSELERMNSRLEAKVNERTAELAAALTETIQEKAGAEFERRRVEILMQELDHRVGNSLAMVSSLLGLQLSQTDDPMTRQAINAARMRVQTIGSSQRRLRLQDDFRSVAVSDLFSAVIDDLVATYGNAQNVQIDYQIAPLLLQARDATSCAILLGELVTNALKYGMDRTSIGRILVGCKPEAAGGISLRVEDSGQQHAIPDQVPVNPSGLGTVILERLAEQYGGEITRARNKLGGMVVIVCLPRMIATHDYGESDETKHKEDR